MVIIGVLLVLLAVLAVAGLLLTPGGTTSIELFGLTVEPVDARSLVVTGLVGGIVLMFGLWLVKAGIGRRLRRRRERKAAAQAETARAEARADARRAELAKAEDARWVGGEPGEPAPEPVPEPAAAPGDEPKRPMTVVGEAGPAVGPRSGGLSKTAAPDGSREEPATTRPATSTTSTAATTAGAATGSAEARRGEADRHADDQREAARLEAERLGAQRLEAGPVETMGSGERSRDKDEPATTSASTPGGGRAGAATGAEETGSGSSAKDTPDRNSEGSDAPADGGDRDIEIGRPEPPAPKA